MPTAGPDVTNVLLVEDNDGDALLIEVMLGAPSATDIVVTRARTLADALEAIDEVPPECVLLDLGLPDSTGLESVQKIKAAAPRLAIVVVNGDHDDVIGFQAVAAGAQDHFVKGAIVGETLARSIRYAVVRKQCEDALHRNQQVLAEAQHIARLGSWDLDLETDTMTWSEELCRLLGFSSRSAPGLDEYVARIHLDDAVLVEGIVRDALAARTPFDLDHRIEVPDQGVRWVRSQGRVESLGPAAPGWMRGTTQDITEQKSAEDALSHQALHDPLTGVPNRTVLLDRLRQSLDKPHRRPKSVGLLFIDVDRFKIINDSLGHEAGDQILVALSERLLAILRPGDTLARSGGDEFTLLCEDLSGEDDAIAIAEQVGAAMSAPLVWNEGELILTVSIGIALADSADASPDGMLRDADAAMYQAKGEGRSRHAVFVEPMRAKVASRLETEVSLRRALTERQLEVHYQPMVKLPSGRLIGTEALVRWRHPTRGLVPPDEFISIAEETGLILPLGAWVMKEAARQTKAWQARPGCSELTVAVNLSGVQLKQAGLANLVAETLLETGLAPSSLELEITESVLMDDAASAVRILQSLKDLGVRLSVDDFGTGYSSLSYLKRFPVNAVKIDRTFVSGLGEDPADSAIVHAVVSLADALGLETIAEGVETKLHLDQLVELGCTYAQGYHFARPKPAAELAVHLDELARPAAHRASVALVAPSAVAAAARSWSIVQAASGDESEPRKSVAILEHPSPPPATRAPDPGGEAVLRATRQLMWITSPADASAVAHDLVTALGATVVPVADAPPHALPVDVSFGVGPPQLPAAEPSSVSTMLLERHLPGFMVDAHRAIELADKTNRLAEDAQLDPLTGLSNRRAVDRLLSRLGTGTTVIVIDLDHFKAVNDQFGHLEGDRVLVSIAASLRATLRAGDHAGRYGGEEFVVVLGPGSVAESFLVRLRTHWESVRPQPISFSAGIAATDADSQHAFAAADRALYRAKAAGRDQWMRADPEDDR